MKPKKILVKIAKNAFNASYGLGLERLAEQIRYFGISNKPPRLFIEPTNKCNLKCIMCPQQHQKRKIGFMSMKLYKKIINDASNLGIEYVKLSPFGEPLLNKNIFAMIKYAKEKGMKEIGFPTNGVLLNREKAKQLLESGIDYISFSIDSLKSSTYKKIRVGAKLKTVLKNILYFISLKKQLGCQKPRVIITALDMKYTHSEIEHIREFWSSKADEVVIGKCVTFDGLEKLTKRKHVKEHACNQIFDRLVILHDGKAIVCCDDFNGELVVGDINKENITQIWNGEKIKRLRKMHLQHDFKKLPVCKKCEAIIYEIDDIIPPGSILDNLSKVLGK